MTLFEHCMLVLGCKRVKDMYTAEYNWESYESFGGGETAYSVACKSNIVSFVRKKLKTTDASLKTLKTPLKTLHADLGCKRVKDMETAEYFWESLAVLPWK